MISLKMKYPDEEKLLDLCLVKVQSQYSKNRTVTFLRRGKICSFLVIALILLAFRKEMAHSRGDQLDHFQSKGIRTGRLVGGNVSPTNHSVTD